MFQARDYIRPASLEEAYQLCQKRRNVVVGGMMWLKMERMTKQAIVDLGGLGLDQIEETDEEFRIGSMATLRMLETHPGLNQAFDGIFQECTRHIVGVQFRNGATVGGSVYGRFGFSDILTCLMALDTYVELYQGGVMPLAEFSEKPLSGRERDILVRVIIKKDGRKAAYRTIRRSKTDFPLIACCAAETEDGWQISVGARPQRAKAVYIKKEAVPELEKEAGKGRTELSGTREEILAAWAAAQFTYGSNLRGSADYRAYLAEVLIRRLLRQCGLKQH